MKKLTITATLTALVTLTLTACGSEERPQNPTYNPADSTYTALPTKEPSPAPTTTMGEADMRQAFINTAELECNGMAMLHAAEIHNITHDEIITLEETTSTTDIATNTTINVTGVLDTAQPYNYRYTCDFNLNLNDYGFNRESFTYLPELRTP